MGFARLLASLLFGSYFIFLSGCSEEPWEITIRESNEVVEDVKNLESVKETFWLEKSYGVGGFSGWAPAVLIIGFADNERECLVISERFEQDGGVYRCTRADLVEGIAR